MSIKKYPSTKNAQKKRQLIRYTGYPNRRNFAIFVVHCIKSGIHKSETARSIIDEWIKENISPNKQEEYLEIYKNLTEKEIKYAGRYYPDVD